MKRSAHMKFIAASMAALTFTTFGVGCGGPMDPGGEGPSSVVRHQALTGSELYKGMVFGVGPAASQFEEIWQRAEIKAHLEKPGVVDQRELAANQLIAKISEQDPTFFDRFSRDLRSGDHLRIDRLLSETKEKTQYAASALRQEAGLPADVSASALERVEAGTWLYVETAVAVVIVALATIFITQIDVTPVTEGPQTSALRRDTWVDLLANKAFDAQ
ncbi:sporulation delaying protein family toxin [Stigmatella sp. ncwal1]|uniref:Sporulation delaying protein family toxin n=1 Tax=Stigmatella ashevillensis TaxID=2995309 RepID=A0ABT5DIT9_9BACT|nr:sporulation delaying protein family toxin [Stigmatella ashevillena]MDC0712247.1 sporulation delaying protein family toxin [Stigmatella ashevillena]